MNSLPKLSPIPLVLKVSGSTSDNSISLEFDGTLITLVVIEQRLVVQAELAHLSQFSDEAALFRFLLMADDRAELAGGNWLSGC